MCAHLNMFIKKMHTYIFDRLHLCVCVSVDECVEGLTVSISEEEEAEEEQAWAGRVHHGICRHMHAVSTVSSLPHCTTGR